MKKSRGCDGFNLLRANTFSNVSCSECGKTTSARYWRCSCFKLWYKCSLHMHQYQAKPRPKAKARLVKDKSKIHFTSKPVPKRKQEHCTDLCRTRVVDDSIRQFKLNPNICPKLAAKFPHLSFTGQVGDQASGPCEDTRSSGACKD